jgi:hypothetical protein
MILSAVLDDPLSADLPLKENRLNIFESEVIPDLRQTAQNILKCLTFPILYFPFAPSKEPKVTWTQVRTIGWMRRAYEAFRLEIFLDFPTIMAF